jgi:F0F1-type ATP synthase membrane subunit b/b'
MTAAAAVATVALTGASVYSTVTQSKANKRALKEQKRANAEQESEIARQKEREQDQQRRENMQLMNTVSNLTNTSFGGVSSPSIDYDKYGDLG